MVCVPTFVIMSFFVDESAKKSCHPLFFQISFIEFVFLKGHERMKKRCQFLVNIHPKFTHWSLSRWHALLIVFLFALIIFLIISHFLFSFPLSSCLHACISFLLLKFFVVFGNSISPKEIYKNSFHDLEINDIEDDNNEIGDSRTDLQQTRLQHVSQLLFEEKEWEGRRK